MIKFKALSHQFNSVLSEKSTEIKPYPLLRDNSGNECMYCISPLHGRSFIVGRNTTNKWVISKGNGLSYSEFSFLNTSKVNGDMWGALFKENAIRDFKIGQEIQSLGIKTNQMEYVLELDKILYTANMGIEIKPYLLQYSVECPYRICDFPFMPLNTFKKEIDKWKRINDKGFTEYYLIAANLLIKNLRIMHDNGIMHNAIHTQNYTWALELVDFESSRTEKIPYANKEYETFVPLLREGEIIQTYEVINYIAWCTNENIEYKKLDSLFEKYGFDLQIYRTDII